MRKSFGPSDFVAVLAALARETGASAEGGGAVGAGGAGAGPLAKSGGPSRLSETQLDMAIAMVQTLSDSGLTASAMEVRGGVLCEWRCAGGFCW